MKVCFKCLVAKEPTEFYKHPQMADGRLGKCKDCARADVSARRIENIDHVRAYDRARSVLPHRKANVAKVGAAWRAKHPGRAAAQTKAIRHHRKAPDCCQMCGLPKRLERHHPDYSLPTLIWGPGRWVWPLDFLPCCYYHDGGGYDMARKTYRLKDFVTLEELTVNGVEDSVIEFTRRFESQYCGGIAEPPYLDVLVDEADPASIRLNGEVPSAADLPQVLKEIEDYIYKVDFSTQ